MVNIWHEHPLISRIFRLFGKRMQELALWITHNQHEAEDIVGECMVRFLQNEASLREIEPDKLPAYVLKSVRNAAIDHLRRQKQEQMHFSAIAPSVDFIAANEQQAMEDAVLTKLYLESYLQLLPPQERKTVELMMEGFGYADIAEQMGVKEATVRKYWLSAKRRIQKHIHLQENDS